MSDVDPLEDTVTAIGFRVTVPVANLVGSTTLVAVTWTVCWLAIIAGALYTPFAIVPTWELKDQVTAVFEVPLSLAVKVTLSPPVSDVDPLADKVTATGFSVTVAVANLVGSATLVAITLRVCWLAMI